MIKANELRIGNWVLCGYELKPTIVESVDDGGINISSGYQGGFERDGYHEDLQPIPLTPEILEKAGFKRHIDDRSLFFLNEFRYSTFFKEIKLLRVCDKAGESQQHSCRFPFLTDQIKIKYLHELQNLYFALTGTELEIREGL